MKGALLEHLCDFIGECPTAPKNLWWANQSDSFPKKAFGHTPQLISKKEIVEWQLKYAKHVRIKTFLGVKFHPNG